MKKIMIAIFLILYIGGAHGQTEKADGISKLKTNNMGLGIGMVHLIATSGWSPSLHLHYSKCLDQMQRFSIGTGMDMLLGDYKNISASLTFEYCPIPPLSIGYGPGIEFPFDNEPESTVDIEEDFARHFNQHFEISYVFDLDILQIGPMVEYEFSGEDKQIMLGLHAGISF